MKRSFFCLGSERGGSRSIVSEKPVVCPIVKGTQKPSACKLAAPEAQSSNHSEPSLHFDPNKNSTTSFFNQFKRTPATTFLHNTSTAQKIIPTLFTPFGLDIKFFPEVDAFLTSHPTMIDAANIMLKPYVADSTEKCYGQVIRDFINFCSSKKLLVSEMSESLIIKFIGISYTEKPLFSYFCKLLPSLAVLENFIKSSNKPSSITTKVNNMIISFKRNLCTFKKPTRKGNLFPIDFIQILIEKEIIPHKDEPKNINAIAFRAIFRAIIMYFTFCRFSDYRILKDTDFYNNDHSIEIIFQKSKNDQYFNGTNSLLSRYENSTLCPVFLTNLYFAKFNLHFASDLTVKPSFINFYLTKKGSAITNRSLSQCNATKSTKNLLTKHNLPCNKFTEKSMKIAGVTALLDSGEPLENVAIAGRWRTNSTPLHYRNTSYKFRLNIAKNIPLSNL